MTTISDNGHKNTRTVASDRETKEFLFKARWNIPAETLKGNINNCILHLNKSN